MGCSKSRNATAIRGSTASYRGLKSAAGGYGAGAGAQAIDGARPPSLDLRSKTVDTSSRAASRLRAGSRSGRAEDRVLLASNFRNPTKIRPLPKSPARTRPRPRAHHSHPVLFLILLLPTATRRAAMKRALRRGGEVPSRHSSRAARARTARARGPRGHVLRPVTPGGCRDRHRPHALASHVHAAHASAPSRPAIEGF